jgi:hypothetical protein
MYDQSKFFKFIIEKDDAWKTDAQSPLTEEQKNFKGLDDYKSPSRIKSGQFPSVQAHLLWAQPAIEALPRHCSDPQVKEKRVYNYEEVP